MAFNGTEGKAIDPNLASEWTRAYRDGHPGQVKAIFFGRDILLSLLAQEGNEGIRIYYGLNNTEPQLIAVGADSSENDQLGGSFIVADEGVRSPPNSGQPNILNS